MYTISLTSYMVGPLLGAECCPEQRKSARGECESAPQTDWPTRCAFRTLRRQLQQRRAT